MTLKDDIILEVLSESGLPMSQKNIEMGADYLDLEVSYPTIQRRLPALVDAGLVEVYDGSGPYFVITDSGKGYLSGDFDVTDAESPR